MTLFEYKTTNTKFNLMVIVIIKKNPFEGEAKFS